MTTLITFAQDFQDFHLVRGDRFAPFKHQIPRLLAGFSIIQALTRLTGRRLSWLSINYCNYASRSVHCQILASNH